MCRVYHVKCQAGWITSWNQDFWEKYQRQICRWYHSNGRKWRGTKEPLMRVKAKSEKVGLKFNIQKTNIMASDLITLWQIDGKQWKQWQTLLWRDPKSLWMVTAAMKLSHLHLGRKARTNLGSILKSRDITLLTKVRLVKAMVFPVVMYGCESWSIKKAECWRIDAF